MTQPVQVLFRGLPANDFLEKLVRRKTERLERHFPRLRSCQVIIERPHRRHRKGQLYSVRVELSVPGPDLVVTRAATGRVDHADPRLAVRDAFRAAERELGNVGRWRRKRAKAGTRQGDAATYPHQVDS